MSLHDAFRQERTQQAIEQGNDAAFASRTRDWMLPSLEHGYSYNFEWLGRPIIQYPQDIVAMQEIIFRVRPDLIIETGIAHGGSLILYASLLELNAACGGPSHARVLGIDIDIREHNRTAIEAHPMCKRITMLQGSSIAPEMIGQVRAVAKDYQRILVVLDSNHTHEHALAELTAYAPLVAAGSYCVVFDTVIENMPEGSFPDRPWDKGNNPMTAVDAFLKEHPEFEIDVMMDAKLMISVAPRGYLKRLK